jgi:hypothetical protein
MEEDPRIAHLSDLLSRATKFYLGSYLHHYRNSGEYYSNAPAPMFLHKVREGWGITASYGDMNEHCLKSDGFWYYKSGSAWPSRDAALEAFKAWLLRHPHQPQPEDELPRTFGS